MSGVVLWIIRVIRKLAWDIGILHCVNTPNGKKITLLTRHTTILFSVLKNSDAFFPLKFN